MLKRQDDAGHVLAKHEEHKHPIHALRGVVQLPLVNLLRALRDLLRSRPEKAALAGRASRRSP